VSGLITRGPVVMVLSALLLTACSGDASSDEYVSMDTTVLYTAALEYLASEGHLTEADLYYVVQPSVAAWKRFCDEPDPFGEQPDVGGACVAVSSIEEDTVLRFTAGSRREIESALQPASVSFVDDHSEAVVVSDSRLLPLPVRDGAGLVALSVAVEVRGKVYLHVDLHGAGVLIEATPTTSGWSVDILQAWMA